ncbi:Hypothetical protein FKW44_025012 [Caligus rogercresseyi]|uniref:Uncharacterized protein n=1 Tax=Caligus rogercresseyi TaxID=217165 RepID=A0A7T8GK21_CALRO|nr:Hypothetical protein FKW44_025012 [Caligus rogercresseyi]
MQKRAPRMESDGDIHEDDGTERIKIVVGDERIKEIERNPKNKRIWIYVIL